MEDIVLPKLGSLSDGKEDPVQLYYSNLKGLFSFRRELKYFFEERFQAVYEIDPEELVVSSGTTSILETLAFAIAEHGDCILVPAPYYYRIANDFMERAGVECWPVPLLNQDKFHLSADKLESAYNKAISEGHTVRGLLLINPHNPLGDIYTKQQLLDCLTFAHSHDLHVIVDEIYALSVFKEHATFNSVMSLPQPDIMKTHIVWGFSKDLGLSGYRCGVLYTRNRNIIEYAEKVGIFQQAAAPVQLKLQELIKDKEWLDQIYFPTYKQRLNDSMTYVTGRLAKLGITVHQSKAGFFVWANMSKYLAAPTFEAEDQLQARFISGKVYILAGRSTYSEEPGWFRIVASNQMELLQLGIDRIETVLHGAHQL
ncbi:1-aminocyclopropane-1-carboxylate synthase-like protein 1 isoform X2 [Haliotis asinina]